MILYVFFDSRMWFMNFSLNVNIYYTYAQFVSQNFSIEIFNQLANFTLPLHHHHHQNCN